MIGARTGDEHLSGIPIARGSTDVSTEARHGGDEMPERVGVGASLNSEGVTRGRPR